MLPALFCLWAGGLWGCGAYMLEGRAVEGPVSQMTFVDADDDRLEGHGVSNVRITVERDAGRLSAQRVASGVSDSSGRFSIPLDVFGAGWMEEQWGIQATLPGFEAATTVQRLPPKGRRLLILLAPGFSPDPREEDLMEFYERYR